MSDSATLSLNFKETLGLPLPTGVHDGVLSLSSKKNEWPDTPVRVDVRTVGTITRFFRTQVLELSSDAGNLARLVGRFDYWRGDYESLTGFLLEQPGSDVTCRWQQ